MTDGPFRNAELRSRWKRYGQDLVSDAVSAEERMAQACHSMIGDVDMKAFSPLFGDLKAHAEHTQIDLRPGVGGRNDFRESPNLASGRCASAAFDRELA